MSEESRQRNLSMASSFMGGGGGGLGGATGTAGNDLFNEGAFLGADWAVATKAAKPLAWRDYLPLLGGVAALWLALAMVKR